MDIQNSLSDVVSDIVETFTVAYKKQKFTDPQPLINRLQKMGYPHWVRQGSECTELIIDDTQFTYTSTKNFPRAKLFLFNSVKQDVKRWLGNKKDIVLPPATKDSHINLDYDDTHGKITGTDLNHAYWRIAFVKGMISEKTYENGLVPDDTNVEGKIKALRLATLSVLGREKKFQRFENGKVVAEIITQQRNPLHQKIFLYIRQSCYNMMAELARKLGDDFESWKVDCIYYRDTPENRKIVTVYFDRKKMTYKQLEYFPDET